MVGFSRFYLNEARQARADGDDAARTAALVGQPRAEMLGEFMGAFACHDLGEFELMKGYLDRALRVARQLSARRFEAQALEKQARILLHEGRRVDAVDLLREALSICRDAGTQFCGPIVMSALSLAVEDPSEKEALLAEGAQMLALAALSRTTISGFIVTLSKPCWRLRTPMAPCVMSPRSRTTRAPSPCRGPLFSPHEVDVSPTLREAKSTTLCSISWKRIRAELMRSGFKPFLGAVDAVLTA